MPIQSSGAGGATSGSVIRIDDAQLVAIYQRDGVCWVADFQRGVGQLIDAASWFRFHAGVLRYSHSRRAAALETMTAISPQLAEQIEQLHHATDVGTAAKARDRGRQPVLGAARGQAT